MSRVFFAPKNLKIGSAIRESLEQAKHLHDRLLLIISRNSISSTWVEREFETAVEREKIENRVVLFPTTIDDSVLVSKKGWAANLRRQRHIGDFRQWQDRGEYHGSLQKLLSDLPAWSGD